LFRWRFAEAGELGREAGYWQGELKNG